MSASHPNEYNIHGTKSSWRNWKRALKRFTNKARRKDGKKHLEDASPRITQG
jgi:hypothetical protein